MLLKCLVTCVTGAGCHCRMYSTQHSYAECKRTWRLRYEMANEGHLDIGCRGVNAFQLSGLKSYECAHYTCSTCLHSGVMVFGLLSACLPYDPDSCLQVSQYIRRAHVSHHTIWSCEGLA